ncbi:MAG: endopeptidase La [Gemmatimonadaceae bacterium]|nr:endopeptidase La [Gemmatimonadaceae bacterium]
MTAPATASIPLLALRSTIVFPGGTIAVQMGAAENLALLAAHPDATVQAVAMVAPSAGAAATAVLAGRIGVLVTVTNRVPLARETIQVTLSAGARVRVESIDQTGAYPTATVTPLPTARATADDRALLERIAIAVEELVERDETLPAEFPALLRREARDPSRFADLAATHPHLRIADRDEVLQRIDLSERLAFLAERFERELTRAEVLHDVKRQTERKIDQHHREFFLRQQLRAIQAELGEADPNDGDAAELLRRIEGARLPERVETEARRDVQRLRALSAASSEHQVIRNYLDLLLALPWHVERGAEEIVLERVEQTLDAGHYGLQEAKERILEFLAVRQLRGGDPRGPILCFVGPPGTGKTSLGEAIATAMGRAFDRISVGGVRDEAEIRGHRRTYVGAQPGRLLEALRRVGTRDPVLMIDEIDKMTGGGAGGDPTAAMLEVLDPGQNASFVDHYLALPFDLSQVLFVCTANNVFDIPPALRDRLEVIRIAGYTLEEKVEIAWRYLLPRLFEQHGITDLDLQFTDEALGLIASRYAREAGLRTFERRLAALMRRRARRKAEGEAGAWIVDAARIDAVLGPPLHAAEAADQEPEVGTVTGLAWTANGGELMTVEALQMPGTGALLVTGQLGEVMRESVYAACSYVRSRARVLRISDPERKSTDLHVHFPQGSVPKDGPSAGVAVTAAIASVMSRRPVRRDIAVTGEVTLRGRILEIGGVKEKVLAAYRAGLRRVMLPAANEKDLREVPPEVRAQVQFTLVESMDQVLETLLLSAAPLTLADDLPLFDDPAPSPPAIAPMDDARVARGD